MLYIFFYISVFCPPNPQALMSTLHQHRPHNNYFGNNNMSNQQADRTAASSMQGFNQGNSMMVTPAQHRPAQANSGQHRPSSYTYVPNQQALRKDEVSMEDTYHDNSTMLPTSYSQIQKTPQLVNFLTFT